MVQQVNGARPTIATGREVGSSGLRTQGGRVWEEFLTELRGSAGVKAYDQMRKNDPMIGAILRATKDTIRSVPWEVEPADEAQENLDDAEFLLDCMNGMSHTWATLLDEVLSMIPFGWAYLEIVYKRRDDARIGWQKVALRGQDSLLKWELDEHGGIQGMWQQTFDGGNFKEIFIPINKSVLFRTESEKNNPEGYSLLRNSWTAYYKKTNLEEIEAIGAEREATGHLKITPPVGADDTDKAAAEDILERYKVDDQMGFYLPRLGKEDYEKWDVDVVRAPGERGYDLDKTIQRYQGEIAMSFLAQFLRLGQSGQKVGSYALSRDQRDLYHLSIKSILDNIQETVNRHMVKPLMELNGISEPYPRVIHGRIGQRDIQTLGLYLQSLANVGGLVIDDNLRQFLREEAELPREPANVDVEEGVVTRPAERSQDRTGEKPRSPLQPQDQENRRQPPEQRQMVEAEPFILTDDMIKAAKERRDKLYEGATNL